MMLNYVRFNKLGVSTEQKLCESDETQIGNHDSHAFRQEISMKYQTVK